MNQFPLFLRLSSTHWFQHYHSRALWRSITVLRSTCDYRFVTECDVSEWCQSQSTVVRVTVTINWWRFEFTEEFPRHFSRGRISFGEASSVRQLSKFLSTFNHHVNVLVSRRQSIFCLLEAVKLARLHSNISGTSDRLFDQRRQGALPRRCVSLTVCLISLSLVLLPSSYSAHSLSDRDFPLLSLSLGNAYPFFSYPLSFIISLTQQENQTGKHS